MMNRIGTQMIPSIKSSCSYIDLPLGPPLVSLSESEGVFKHNRYSATTGTKPIVEKENMTYNAKNKCNIIANRVEFETSSATSMSNYKSGSVAGNVLDDYVRQQLNMCVKSGAVSDLNDAYVISIPQNGSKLSEVINFRSALFGGKVYALDSLLNPKIGIPEGATQRTPHILITRKQIDDKMVANYTFIGTTHVPTLNITYLANSGTCKIAFSSLNSDAEYTVSTKDEKGNITEKKVEVTCDNQVYIYVVNPSVCNGNYNITKMIQKINEQGLIVSYFTIDYTGYEFPVTPKFLRKRIENDDN